MTTRRPDEERVWLNALHHAISGLSAIDRTLGDGENWPFINRELARDAAQIADGALAEWRERYPEEGEANERHNWP